MKKLSLVILSLLLASQSQSETLKMSVNSPNVPFLYGGENKTLGMDIELITAIGEEENFDLEISVITFPQILDNLNNEHIDLIGNIYFSEERQAQYSLSQPYFVDKLVFLKQGDNNQNFLEENINVAVLSFSPLEATLKEIQKDYPNIQITPVDTSYLGFRHMMQNEQNLFLTTQTAKRYFETNYPQYEYETLSVPSDYNQEIAFSWMTRKNNQELTQRINQGLEKIKANGKYEDIIKQYQ